MRCPKCGSAKNIKHGSYNEKSRFKCKNRECGATFSEKKKEKFSWEDKLIAVYLHKDESVGKRDIAKIIGCGSGMLYKWEESKKNIMSKVNCRRFGWNKRLKFLFQKADKKLDIELKRRLSKRLKSL